MYSMGATYSGMKALPVALREDFSLDADAFIARMKAEKPALVFIAYPNNPTGVLYPEADVVRLIKACPGLVVVDEAYHVFAGKSLMPRLPEFDNLIIIRTVSKLGLAGIRLGYMAGRPEWIEQFDKVRPPYNVGVLTQAAALFLLERLDVLEAQAERIRKDRGELGRSLAAFKGVTVFPSEANFFLLRVPDAARTYEALKQQNVLVKNLHPAIPNCLRVTVGTPDENRILLTALREAL
jgi:histidinol-phosphate aminotransferase